MKIKEKQIQKLKELGLLEGFFDSLRKSIKQLTDKDLDKIAKRRNDNVADFLKDFKKNPHKYGY